MKRLVIIGLCAVIALAGCTQKADTVSPSSTPEVTADQTVSSTPEVSDATQTPEATPAVTPVVTPSPTPQPEPVTYAIDGKTIVREQGSDKTVIYNVTDQYPEDWDCGLNSLAVEPEALYFTEYAQPQNGDFLESKYAIVCIGFDGSGRRVLKSEDVIGFLQIAPYGDRIFFVQDGFDSVEIGWVWRDGSGSGWLDLTDYAAHYGVMPYCGYANLYMKGGMLYADILLYGDLDAPDQEHTIRIGTNLLIQHVSG